MIRHVGRRVGASALSRQGTPFRANRRSVALATSLPPASQQLPTCTTCMPGNVEDLGQLARFAGGRARVRARSVTSLAGDAPTDGENDTTKTRVENGGESDEHASHLVSTYERMVEEGKWTRDVHQLRALAELDRLRSELLLGKMGGTTGEASDDISSSVIGDDEERESASPFGAAGGGGRGFFGRIFSTSPAAAVRTALRPKPPRGVYLHGGVGCGKTFCMDMFYDSLRVGEGTAIIKAQKWHYHKFMLERVHRQMHEAKMVEGVDGDVLPRVIERILEDGSLLCFDEFQVTDVADALILRRLFTGLLEQGAVIVATSNRPPRDLYMNGLQRDRFIPFIDLLEEKLSIVSMWESETDYRLILGENKAKGVYFIGDSARTDFDEVFMTLTKNSPVAPTSLVTQGRRVPIPKASVEYGVARFTFDDLCRTAMGAADYLVIGENFHTVFVESVPMLTMNDINVVRRFITFIDCMYENNVKIVMQLETLPKHIFFVDLDNQYQDEAFAFDRTRSRLDEMGSSDYLKKRWTGRKSGAVEA